MLAHIKFAATFAAVAWVALLLTRQFNIVGIVVIGCVSCAAAEWLTRTSRLKKGPSSGWWSLVFSHSAIAGVLLSAGVIALLALMSMATSISGSPYDVPDLNYTIIFSRVFLLAFVPVAGCLMLLRRAERQPPLG